MRSSFSKLPMSPPVPRFHPAVRASARWQAPALPELKQAALFPRPAPSRLLHLAMKTLPIRHSRFRLIAAVLLSGFSVAPRLAAQQVAPVPTSSTDATSDQAVVLSPFTVTTDKDNG